MHEPINFTVQSMPIVTKTAFVFIVLIIYHSF